jgi:hypothetical protein
VITNIKPTTRDIYWFVDLGETIISGVTEPGQLTTSKFDVDQNEDTKILVDRLEGREHKLKENGSGFALRDGSVVFSRTALDVSQLDSSSVKMKEII